MKFTRANPDSFDVRKSPLIPALVIMTMTSFSPINSPVNFLGSNAGICQDAAGANISREGFSLFLQQEREKHTRKQSKTGKLASSKGVNLPLKTSCLPDETLDFLASQDIVPDFINSSNEGSLIIEFNTGGSYHLVEFFPDGEIVFLKKDNDGTDAWDLTNENYLGKLKEELSTELEAQQVE